MSTKVEISAIIPVSDRYDDICELYRGYKKSLEEYNHLYEIIFVLDGEKSEVFKQLLSLQEKGEQFKIIQLTKFFGEATALTAAFEHSQGDVILTLPAYFQVEPSEIPKVLNEQRNYDMVISRRQPRAGSTFERIRRRTFHWILHFVTGYRFHDLGSNIRAFKRQVLIEVPIYGDQHRFLPVLAGRRGFRVTELDLRQSEKDYFRQRYRTREYIHRMLDILTVFFLIRFTKKPLRLFGMIGITTFIAGSLITLYLVTERLFFGIALADRPALLLSSLLVVLGVQIIAIGLLGELIIFTHAKEIKEYTIDKIIN